MPDRTPLNLDLIERYNRPGPRYTSYPTAPIFTEEYHAADYIGALRAEASPYLSLYAHLPFCRRKCYYCGCHMMVTHKPEKIENYLGYLDREIDLVRGLLPDGRSVNQIHWGGGTPSYLEPDQIRRLMYGFSSRFSITPDAEVSMEVDPRGLTRAHLEAARESGFNRISMGVQDFDPTVQAAINRIQPEEIVSMGLDWCRSLDFSGVSFDLIYGLPHQKVASFSRTLDRVLALGPDRISLFNYAHLPQLMKHQSLIDATALPDAGEKMRIFTTALDRLTRDGDYRAIGMDHFARPSDTLVQAMDGGTLHRNFQGYTTHAGSTLVAFGVSGISMLDRTYAQNVKGLPAYYRAIDRGEVPVYRGVHLTDDDVLRRYVIERLMCSFDLDLQEVAARFGVDVQAYFADEFERLDGLVADGLVVLSPDRIQVTQSGRLFIRNVAMVFDAYLSKRQHRSQFSRTI